MKIILTLPGSDYRSVVETDQLVTITDAFIGPIFTNGDVNVSIFARDGHFEGFCWRGSADHHEVLPADAIVFTLTPDGVEEFKG